MIKFLTILWLCVGSLFPSFASSLCDESVEFNRLRLQAKAYFEAGELENERLTRIEILLLKQELETVHLAVQSCVICEKFEVAKYLLKTFSHSFKSSEIQTLRDYCHDEKIKLENRKRNFKAEEQEESPEFKTDDKGQIVIFSNMEIKLNILKLLTREYFRRGDYEQELLKLIEIAKIKKDFFSFKRALEQCVVCEKFKAGNDLLNMSNCLRTNEIQELCYYLQDQETKFSERTAILGRTPKKK
ncbi:MAG: hypothetical protein BGO77_07140 [Caedibacter sp. 37-49]|nr:MAG: hypothetical protein BGO77_07140 [Caedibacter sp. 37-49]